MGFGLSGALSILIVNFTGRYVYDIVSVAWFQISKHQEKTHDDPQKGVFKK